MEAESLKLAEREDALFARWRVNLPGFVTDGAVDQHAYAGSALKILFLLKEVNDPDGGGWCLREFLRNGGQPATWSNVTRWVLAIRSLPREMSWESLRDVTELQRREALRSIAAVNLKKLPGGTTTEEEEFWSTVKEHSQYLREQFNLYDADIVICCGRIVAEAFDIYLKPIEAGLWRNTSRGVRYLEYAPHKFVLAYSHPEARVADNLLHYGLVDAVREVLEQREGLTRA